MEQPEFICCFTGHRQIPAEHIEKLHRELDRVLNILIRSGVQTFRAGGAIGFDTLAALTVLDKRELHPHIRLELCLPCRDQTNSWGAEDIAIYNDIMRRADKVTVLNEHYTKFCMHQRNRYMVDGSHFCVGYCTSDKGGTAYTMSYAKSKGVKTTNLAELLFF